jgi:hypothetical protein
MTAEQVEEVETASAVRRGIEVWYAAFGGIAAWTVHFLFVVSAEHWSYLHGGYAWTLHVATALCAAATVVAMVLAARLHAMASGRDPSSNDDAGQLLFLAQLGLLVGAINLALILLEGAYAVFIPRG